MEPNWSFESVAIVGAGAVGLYYGARLAAAGENVSFLLRSDYAAISKGGIRIDSVDGDLVVDEVRGFLSPQEIGPVDLVVISWKSTANAMLGGVLPPLLHDHTQVLTLQNGLGNCEEIAKVVGDRRVLGGLCFVCLNRLEPGYVRHTAGGRMSVGEWQTGSASRTQEIERRFRAAGICCEAVGNLAESQWKKLVWNIPFNGLAIAEGGVTTDELLAAPQTEREIRELMGEVIRAARALGLNLNDALIDINIERTHPMGAYRPSSMIDFIEGRAVEIDSIWLEPLRQGRAAGVAMPRLETLLHRIAARLAERDQSC